MGNQTAIKVARAFIDGRKMSLGNYRSTGDCFLLFGNEIATKVEGGFVITDCHYCTQTTATALCALPNVKLRRYKAAWVWDEKERWFGESKFIEYKH